MLVAGKKVTVMVGFIPLRTRIEPAVDDESSGFRTVCTGLPEGSHEPSRVKMHADCQVCDRSHSSVFAYAERGVEHGDKLVVLTKDEIAKAKGEPITGRDGKALPHLSFHPREKVYAATVTGDSVQNVYPDKGGEAAYTLLRDTLRDKPNVVACMIWAPTTANSLWVLEVVDERIVATKRAWPESVRAPQVVPVATSNEAEQLMFRQYVDASIEDFDLTVYRDQAKRSLDELVAASDGVSLATTSAAAAAAIPDMLAALQANLEAAGCKVQPVKAVPKKRAPAKKAPAKKAAAKKAAAKKTSTRKAAAPKVEAA
jgi:DNA end-binding protein Ku